MSNCCVQRDNVDGQPAAVPLCFSFSVAELTRTRRFPSPFVEKPQSCEHHSADRSPGRRPVIHVRRRTSRRQINVSTINRTVSVSPLPSRRSSTSHGVQYMLTKSRSI